MFEVSTSPEMQVLLYYLYFPLEDPETYMVEHRQLCESLGLKGRILLGNEGINGTVSGTLEGTEEYMKALWSDPRTKDIEFKIDPCDEHLFPKLSIKVRDEIVTLGLTEEQDIDPNEITGKRLSPREFYEAMNEEDVVIIDGRNKYEADMGKFTNAIVPEIDSFREFPEWFKEHADEIRDRKILTYCTGGIRCEKLSGFLKKEGCEEVYQLHGGIVSYAKDPEVKGRDFEGLCYVFDKRVGVETNFTETRKIISTCRYCNATVPEYSNCGWPNCNRQFFICPNCLEKEGSFCSSECRDHAAENTG
ncbi:MAG: rhodanese-related sulfurtransferase [Verrucomicrobiales bacterium]|nr:rhodanese-related sulfurtransferase [Verrucomicrobiales bacterium]